jgi:DNA-binding LytR/AlgR family response regulator
MMGALNILLVEDEFMTRRLLRKKLTELGHHVVGEADNTDDALAILEKEQVDLAMLDINLGNDSKDGIWLGEYIRFNVHIPFIYLTAYDTSEIVDRAIHTQPHAYLTKPFSEVGLRTTLAIAAQQYQRQRELNNQQVRHLLVKDGSQIRQIPIEEITYLEAEGNYLIVNTQSRMRYRYRATIKILLKNLPGDLFLQTHRAFIVNRKAVTGRHGHTLLLGSYSIPISKGNLTDVLEALGFRDSA